MKTIKLFIFFILITFTSQAVRRDVLINDNWMFRFAHQVSHKSERRVDLPHTWNAKDALAGIPDYYRGTANYTRVLKIPEGWKGKRLFLRFEGANTVTDVFINQRHIGEHRGGYGAFVFEITDWIEYGKDNQLQVSVSNALHLDVMPLVGDFNFYGGIYRDVHLLVTEETCISPLDYASPGVYLIQESVSPQRADVKARIAVSGLAVDNVNLNVRVYDGKKVVKEAVQPVEVKPSKVMYVDVPITIGTPHLWNGRQDPFMYRVEVTLSKGDRILDKVEQPLGVRFFELDADRGFSLNGRPLRLHGVCRHQDRIEVGNALRPEHHIEDAALIAEVGANVIRLAHYPQATMIYDLMDKYGLVVWAEIPFVGPGGYQDQGFVNTSFFRQNGKEQLIELIRQHYNHPSICFWGLFNELKTPADNPLEYVRELNELAHKEDPTRIITSASNLNDDNELNRVTDAICWNKYFGWYGGNPDDLGAWADKVHAAYPQLKIGISEYGAGASIYHQQDSLKKVVPTGWWHPENWQTYYHMKSWGQISERPFIWGSFIWAFFDFGAAHRTEGDRPGINDKGLVTFDRKVKKDAFYYYKANWDKDNKFVYIAERRCKNRVNPQVDIMVFTNLPEASLWVNGQYMGKAKADKWATVRWENMSLIPGANRIEVKSVDKKKEYSDTVEWILQ